MGNFVLTKSRAEKKLPNLQLFVGRGGIERTQFLDGISLHFLFRVFVPQRDSDDAVRPQESYDPRYAVRYSAVILSAFFCATTNAVRSPLSIWSRYSLVQDLPNSFRIKLYANHVLCALVAETVPR